MTDTVELLLGFLSWLLLLTTLVFVVGIVWRVGAELDRAYKCFALAVITQIFRELLLAAPAMHVHPLGGVILAGVEFFSALMLFLGMYFMRDLIRRLDGEKK